MSWSSVLAGPDHPGAGKSPRRAGGGGDSSAARGATRRPISRPPTARGRAALLHPPRPLPAPGAGDADLPQQPERDRAADPPWGSFLPGTGVGGAGVHWNGQTWRFQPAISRSHEHRRALRQGVAPAWRSIRTGGSPTTNSSRTTTASSTCAASPARPATCKGAESRGRQSVRRRRASATIRRRRWTWRYGPALFAKAANGASAITRFRRPSANMSQAYTNPDGVTLAPVHLLRLLRALRLRQLLEGEPADRRPAGADAQDQFRAAHRQRR